MRSAQQRPGGGFTLIEMLVVLTIVALLTAISIPSLVRMGAFTSNEVGEGARDLYQMLRAAKVYATTNNVETALVYQVRFEYETANDGLGILGAEDDIVPVIDGYLLCRRATDKEVESINSDFLDAGTPIGLDEPVFIPVEGSDGQFRQMPAGTCILPDVFEVNGALSAAGLSPVLVIDRGADSASINQSGLLMPVRHIFDGFGGAIGDDNDGDGVADDPDDMERMHYELAGGTTLLDDGTPNTLDLQNPLNPVGTTAYAYAFPAHRFAPSGEITPPQVVQRFTLRVGLKPDALIRDRFVSDALTVEYDPIAGPPTDAVTMTIQFHRMDADTDPSSAIDTGPDPDLTETITLFHNPLRETRNDADPAVNFTAPIENTANVMVYTATGRVKIDTGR